MATPLSIPRWALRALFAGWSVPKACLCVCVGGGTPMGTEGVDTIKEVVKMADIVEADHCQENNLQ